MAAEGGGAAEAAVAHRRWRVRHLWLDEDQPGVVTGTDVLLDAGAPAAGRRVCVCQQCGSKVGVTRFAQHLEQCSRRGLRRSRAARPASVSSAPAVPGPRGKRPASRASGSRAAKKRVKQTARETSATPPPVLVSGNGKPPAEPEAAAGTNGHAVAKGKMAGDAATGAAPDKAQAAEALRAKVSAASKAMAAQRRASTQAQMRLKVQNAVSAATEARKASDNDGGGSGTSAGNAGAGVTAKTEDGAQAVAGPAREATPQLNRNGRNDSSARREEEVIRRILEGQQLQQAQQQAQQHSQEQEQQQTQQQNQEQEQQLQWQRQSEAQHNLLLQLQLQQEYAQRIQEQHVLEQQRRRQQEEAQQQQQRALAELLRHLQAPAQAATLQNTMHGVHGGFYGAVGAGAMHGSSGLLSGSALNIAALAQSLGLGYSEPCGLCGLSLAMGSSISCQGCKRGFHVICVASSRTMAPRLEAVHLRSGLSPLQLVEHLGSVLLNREGPWHCSLCAPSHR